MRSKGFAPRPISARANRPPDRYAMSSLHSVPSLVVRSLGPLRTVGRGAAFAALFVFASAALAGVGAQEMANLPQVPATPSLRPYWHVFAAYAIAIALIGGWAFSIARRLRDVEDRLTQQGE